MECELLSLRRSRPLRAMIQVEHLEARWCPDGKTAPTLVFSVVQMTDPGVWIAGQVMGSDNAYSTVEFTGAVDYSLTTQANGTFSFGCNANYLGVVSGVAWNNLSVQTPTVNHDVTSNDPAFASFNAVRGNNNVWTFSGHVDNEELWNNRVDFYGLPELSGQYVFTDDNGNFSLSLYVDPSHSGMVVAMATDCWGLTGYGYNLV
jgi:hypothetical protein